MSSHRGHHTPSTASFQDAQLAAPSKVSHLSADVVVLNSLHSVNLKVTNRWSLSFHCASLLVDRLQVLNTFHSIISWKLISILTRLWPPSASLSSLNLSVQLHHQSCSIMAAQFISKLDQSRPPSEPHSSLNLSLQVHVRTRSIMASKCIPEITQCRSTTGSSNLLDHGVQVHV